MASQNDGDIQAPGNEVTVQIKRNSTSRKSNIELSHYAVAAVAILVLVAICYPLQSIIGYQTIALILLFAVTLLPLRLGTGPVLLAAAMSALVWNFFFIPPAFTFAIGHPHDVLMFIAYFVIAAVTGILTTRIRAREQTVRLREERTQALYSLTQELSSATSLDEVVRTGIENIKKFIKAESVLCLSENDGDMLAHPHPFSTIKTDEKEFNVIAWVYWNEQRAGRFTDTYPSASATYYPISGPRYPLGVLGVRLLNNEKMRADQESLLENFIKQIASALEREQLNELSRKTLMVEESERLYKNLFDSLSHEFKTPIATILGSADQLSVLPSSHEPDRSFVGEIKVAAERLERLVENLLDMTRLESGHITPKLDWCDMHDLINAAVEKMHKELLLHDVTVDIQSDMPLVKLDFSLIEQVICNLLHNAAVYTPAGSKVLIHAMKSEYDCVVTISDNGPGFPKETLSKLFEKFYRVPGTRTGGTGLGLSIARGFVEAHKGSIHAQNKNEGGAQFIIRLPLSVKNSSDVVERES